MTYELAGIVKVYLCEDDDQCDTVIEEYCIPESVSNERAGRVAELKEAIQFLADARGDLCSQTSDCDSCPAYSGICNVSEAVDVLRAVVEKDEGKT